MLDLHTVLRQPTIGLKLAGDPRYGSHHDVPPVLHTLYRMAGKCAKDSISAQHNRMIEEYLADAIPSDFDATYEEFTASIRDIHRIMHEYAMDFFPATHHHRFSSDGIVSTIEDPAQTLCAIFNPRHIPGVGELPAAPPLEEIRSWVALRTWFCALRWMEDRRSMETGQERMRRVTAAFERTIFHRFDEGGRMETLNIRYNPKRGFTFQEVNGRADRDTTPLHLSRRVIKTKQGTINVFFVARVKSPRSAWGKARRRQQVKDLIAETIIFLNKEDYLKARPMLQNNIFHDGTAKVENEKRIDADNNPDNFSYKGVFWSGTVHMGGVASELECSTLERYFNGLASLTLFNHHVYEARRFTRPRDGHPSLCEMLFPGKLYVPLDPNLRRQIVLRRLYAVVPDFYGDDSRAITEIARVNRVLKQNPHGIDAPHKVPSLVT